MLQIRSMEIPEIRNSNGLIVFYDINGGCSNSPRNLAKLLPIIEQTLQGFLIS